MESNDRKRRYQRAAYRALFLVLVGIFTIDTMPFAWMLGSVKARLSERLRIVGLEQGSWRMFTSPSTVNHHWLTADRVDSRGRSTTWSSPYWANVGGWEKFYRFRHLTYYTHLQGLVDDQAAHDLAEYLREKTPPAIGPELPGDMSGSLGGADEMHPPNDADPDGDESYTSVTLYTNGLLMHLPEDRQMVPAEEIVWTTFSHRLASVE